MFAFLVRFILFMVAISVVRSVVMAVQRMFSGAKPPLTARASNPQTRPAQGATMLQQDPVCGTYVAIDSSLKRIVHGKVVHFCSNECRDKYAG
jgi:YHS domain-containing protein